VKRGEFIALFGGSVMMLPLAARAERRDLMKRIGVMFSAAEGDPPSAKDLAAFKSDCKRWVGMKA
jgi:hypothetical protein